MLFSSRIYGTGRRRVADRATDDVRLGITPAEALFRVTPLGEKTPRPDSE